MLVYCRVILPHTEIEQEIFLEKYNEMILARAETEITLKYDQKVNIIYLLVKRRNCTDERLL